MQKKQAPQEIKGKKSSWPQTFPEQHCMWQINGANFYLVLRKSKVWPKSVTTYFHELIWKTGPATDGLKHEGSQENPTPISLLWTFPSLSCAKTNTCHLTTQLLLQLSGVKAVLPPHATYVSLLGEFVFWFQCCFFSFYCHMSQALWRPCHQTWPLWRKSQHIPKVKPTQATELEINNKRLVKDSSLLRNVKHLFWIQEDIKWSILN